jgi:hypothetical protein
MPDRPPHPEPGVPSLTVTAAVPGPSGGASVVVASDALLAQLDALGRLSDELRLVAGAVVGMLDRPDAVGSIAFEVPLAALDSRRVMSAALRALWTAQQRASDIRDGLLRSIERYTTTEDIAASVVHTIDEQLAWGLGVFVRAFAVPIAVAVGASVLADCAILGLTPGELVDDAQAALREHGRILTNPVTVAAIREAASDADGFGSGFAGVPLGITDALEQTGAIGVPSSAATVVAIGNAFGLLKDTPVTVRKTSSFEYGSPPTTLLDRANSFPEPHSDPNGEQIRIDRYVTPGRPDRFDVYIAGTVTFDPKTGSEPFDFQGDLAGVANESTASYRAVESAMAQAGITAKSPVVLNGYSQGGLIASLVASSGKYNVKGVVTFGAPSSQVHVPSSIPVLSVRNSEDLVPATSGYDTNPSAVVVQRAAFAHGGIPTDWAVPAHRLSYYQETAAVVDQSASGEVRGVLDPLDSFAAGTHRVDSTLWVATRIQPAPPTECR